MPPLHHLVLLAHLASLAATTASSVLTPKPIIIDTDIFSDVDDVGALAIANALQKCGLADLRAVVVNTESEFGSLAVSAVNAYYGNGDVPIAALRPLTQEVFVDRWGWKLSDYASKLAHNFPHPLPNASTTSPPVALYRSLLASAPNASLTLISLGFLTNLAALLASPSDSISALPGSELAAAKITELVIMGGTYPSGWEFNFGGVDPRIAAFVLSHWPRNVPITFSGSELGEAIWSGQQLGTEAPADSPVLAAYQWYGDRCNTTRKSYDPVTVLYGVLGLEGFGALGLEGVFEYANVGGRNEIVGADGSNAWVEDSGVENQHWLRLRESVRVGEVEAVLNQLLALGPSATDCWLGALRDEALVVQPVE